MSERLSFNIGFAGEAGVGKTSIITRMIQDTFEAGQGSTIGTTFYRKDVSFDGRDITLCLTDTAGQEQFRSMTVVYFVNVSLAVVVFSISDQNWKANVSNIIERIRTRNQTCMILLVANKSDLRDVDFSELSEWHNYADANKYLFICVSAKTGAGFEELERLMCEYLLEHHEKMIQETPPKLLVTKYEKNACCG